jgi:RNA-directed DNA polymerase
MTAKRLAGAASDGEVPWHSIDWAKAHRTVRKLQMRMAKAVRDGRWGEVKALQWLLTHSFYGKAIAVKRVTENQGKTTPGVWTEKSGIHRRRKLKLLRHSSEGVISPNL